jgi:MYXO-CTERM domain-containing protein
MLLQIASTETTVPMQAAFAALGAGAAASWARRRLVHARTAIRIRESFIKHSLKLGLKNWGLKNME